MLRRSVAGVVVVALGAALGSCTPRPNDAEPAAESFLGALEKREVNASLVDNAGAAESSLHDTWDGLQAEGLSASLLGVTQDGNVATASYELRWDLPRERDLTYTAQMTLTQSGDTWNVRWQPSMLHPRLGANQHLELRSVAPEQASVVSSDGVELLRPGTAHRVLVDTDTMRSARSAASAISAALAAAHETDRGVPLRDPDGLANELSAATGTYSVAVVPAPARDAFESALAGEPGVRLNEEAAMVNTEPDFAPDIMARVGELVRDDLEGDAGWSVDVVNENGASYEEVKRVDAAPAPAVHISLDHRVQRAAEDALEPVAGQQAMIVALRPSTGGILAIAQTPAADAEGNLATMGQYPPGSTFKILTAFAALTKQGLEPASAVPCPGAMNIYGRTVTNYAGFSLGTVPLETAFARSCNTTLSLIHI